MTWQRSQGCAEMWLMRRTWPRAQRPTQHRLSCPRPPSLRMPLGCACLSATTLLLSNLLVWPSVGYRLLWTARAKGPPNALITLLFMLQLSLCTAVRRSLHRQSKAEGVTRRTRPTSML
jgi:hypothetical protein